MYTIKNKTITLDKDIFKNYKLYYLKKDDDIFMFDSKFSAKINEDGLYELFLKKNMVDLSILNIIVFKKPLTMTKIKAEKYINEFNNFISRGIDLWM